MNSLVFQQMRESSQLDQFVSATQMCKATGKRWNNYWQNEQTQAFIEALSANTGIPVKGLVISRRGNDQQGGGTWVHRRVALHLAQWCSPEFAVWVYCALRLMAL